jgi:hypothetical protein
MRFFILGFAAMAAMTAPLGRAGGQEAPATIPVDLALALLERTPDVYGSRAPAIIVGRAPDGIPPSLTSMQYASLLGGLVESNGVVVVLKSSLPPNQVLTSYDKQLTGSGWGPPPPPPNAERGGFVSNVSLESFSNLYCSDSGAVTVSYSPAPRGGTYLKVRYSRDRESNYCMPRAMAIMGLPALKFPVLLPPPGMTQRSGGGGSGGDHISTSAQLLGPIGPAEAIAHYVKQLEAAGWKMGSLASSGGTSIASAETRDPGGKLWRGALIAQGVSDSELEVELRMARPSAP